MKNHIADPARRVLHVAPATRPAPTPIHAALLAEVQAFRVQAEALANRVARYPHVRPTSNEATFLRYVTFCLSNACGTLDAIDEVGGELQLEFFAPPAAANWFALDAVRIVRKPPPAQVIDLAAERAKRRAAQG